VMLMIAIVGALGLLRVLKREAGLNAKRLVKSELAGVFGGFLALVIMAKVSSSGFTDAGGPADWFLIFGVYGAGLIATTILAYAILGSLKRSLTISRKIGSREADHSAKVVFAQWFHTGSY